MREDVQPTRSTTPTEPNETGAASTEVDADFQRHSRALASQRGMTGAEALQFHIGEQGAISHW